MCCQFRNDRWGKFQPIEMAPDICIAVRTYLQCQILEKTFKNQIVMFHISLDYNTVLGTSKCFKVFVVNLKRIKLYRMTPTATMSPDKIGNRLYYQ